MLQRCSDVARDSIAPSPEGREAGNAADQSQQASAAELIRQAESLGMTFRVVGEKVLVTTPSGQEVQL